MDNKIYTVYKHTNKINRKCYIGITKQKPERRWRNGNGYANQAYFYNSIQKYGWCNFEHKILYEKLTKEEAEQKEVELISYYKSNQREFGYNIQDGGNCPDGNISENTKLTLRELFGKSVSQYSKDGNFIRKFNSFKEAEEITNLDFSSISKCCRNEIKTCGGFIWRYSDEVLTKEYVDWCNNIVQLKRRKSVSQYSRDGDFINKYDSMLIAEKESGINSSSIIKCCKGLQGIAGNYIWRYSDEELTKEHLYWCNSVCQSYISQYDKNGNFIKKYESATNAEICTGVSATSILYCCKNKRKTAGNYIWRYGNEELTQEHIDWCNETVKRHNARKKVIQYTKDDVFVSEYESIKDASLKTSINKSNISSCCSNRIKYAGGYIWKYASDIS